MATISRDEIASAVRLHQAGDLVAAARLYESILERDTTHADAFHLLGLARHQQGQSWLAVDLIGRAVALRPAAAVFHATLGEAYRALGQFDRAASSCRSALELGLNDPAVQNNLGLALHALGRPAEAAAAFRAVLEQRPADAPAHTNLGAALRALDSTERHLATLRRAVALDAKLAAAQSNLGQLLLDLGRPSEALPYCREAVILQPNLPEAHNNLGNAHRALGRFPEAIQCYSEALRLNPDLAQAHVSLGLRCSKPSDGTRLCPGFAGRASSSRARSHSLPCWPRPPSSEKSSTKRLLAIRECSTSILAWLPPTTPWVALARGGPAGGSSRAPSQVARTAARAYDRARQSGRGARKARRLRHGRDVFPCGNGSRPIGWG